MSFRTTRARSLLLTLSSALLQPSFSPAHPLLLFSPPLVTLLSSRFLLLSSLCSRSLLLTLSALPSQIWVADLVAGEDRRLCTIRVAPGCYSQNRPRRLCISGALKSVLSTCWYNECAAGIDNRNNGRTQSCCED